MRGKVKWGEWAVVVAIIGVLMIPGVGRWAAFALVALLVLVVLEAAGLLRWLHPRR